MTRHEQELVQMVEPVDRLLAATEDEQVRRVLLNFRTHVLWEILGEFDRFLGPDLTVPHPVYRLTEAGQTMVLDGMDAVLAFYEQLKENEATVLWPTEMEIAVAPWGIAGETTINHIIPGRVLAADGFDVDAAATYLLRHRVALAWHYDERGRLLGEHVYEDAASRGIEKLDDREVITIDRARELLLPVLTAAPANL